MFTHSKFTTRYNALFQQCLHKYLTTNLGHMGWADLEPKQSIDLISKFDRKQNRSCNNCVLSYHWIFCIMNRCGTDKKPHKLTSVCQSSWNFGGLCLAWLGSCLTPFGVDQIIESDSITPPPYIYVFSFRAKNDSAYL